jgi:hypothetical protein
MENATLAVGQEVVGGRSVGLRVSSVIAALALVFAMFVLVHDRADASPVGSSAAVAASVAAAVGVDNAQINFGQLICAILISVRSAFSGSPFFSFVVAALNPIIVAFGCSPS